MQAQGVLFGQIAAVIGIVIAGVWSATQWTAAALGYQLRLGSPWFDFLGTPVYHPWRLFEWWFFFDAYAPHVFDIGGAIAGGSGLVAVVVAIAMSVWRSRQSRMVTTYGSARWAEADDIRKAGLTQPAGVFLGKYRNEYLRHEGPEHVLTFAPTRSGKGVGLVVPTLLSWPASAVIHDIKGENWQITAGWRSRFSHCLLFNPTDAKSAAYNPLLEVRRGVHEVRDVQNIADILVDPEGALEKRNHWEKTSHALLVGAILHVLYAGEDKTLRGVANFLSDPASLFELTLHRMMTAKHLGDAPHPVVASAAREVLNKSDNERSGVLSTTMSLLGLYRDPTVAEVTSRCDWRIADLIASEHPVSLYLEVGRAGCAAGGPLQAAAKGAGAEAAAARRPWPGHREVAAAGDCRLCGPRPRPQRCAAQGSRSGGGIVGVLPLRVAGRAGSADAGGRHARLRRQCGLRPAGGRACLDGGPACRPDRRAEPARPERGVPESRNHGNP
jgi:probable plasmid conjugation trag transmembrane protein